MGAIVPSSDDLRRVIEQEMGAVLRENEELRSSLVQLDRVLQMDRARYLEESRELSESINLLTVQVLGTAPISLRPTASDASRNPFECYNTNLLQCSSVMQHCFVSTLSDILNLSACTLYILER
eukprot:1678197-Pyramimonas_sp.AAC.1